MYSAGQACPLRQLSTVTGARLRPMTTRNTVYTAQAQRNEVLCLTGLCPQRLRQTPCIYQDGTVEGKDHLQLLETKHRPQILAARFVVNL